MFAAAGRSIFYPDMEFGLHASRCMDAWGDGSVPDPLVKSIYLTKARLKDQKELTKQEEKLFAREVRAAKMDELASICANESQVSPPPGVAVSYCETLPQQQMRPRVAIRNRHVCRISPPVLSKYTSMRSGVAAFISSRKLPDSNAPFRHAGAMAQKHAL